VTELKFDRSLYAGPSVDEAVKAFVGYAELTCVEEPSAWVVRIEGERAVEVSRELSNYALGLTIRARGRGQR
jgi:hypothetical protein